MFKLKYIGGSFDGIAIGADISRGIKYYPNTQEIAKLFERVNSVIAFSESGASLLERRGSVSGVPASLELRFEHANVSGLTTFTYTEEVDRIVENVRVDNNAIYETVHTKSGKTTRVFTSKEGGGSLLDYTSILDMPVSDYLAGLYLAVRGIISETKMETVTDDTYTLASREYGLHLLYAEGVPEVPAFISTDNQCLISFNDLNSALLNTLCYRGEELDSSITSQTLSLLAEKKIKVCIMGVANITES